MCSAENLNFGECNASKFEIEISDIEDIAGLKIQAYVNVAGYEEEVIVFTGYVDSAKAQPEQITRKIIAYDELKKHADDNVSEWYSSQFSSEDKEEYQGSWDSAKKYLSGNIVNCDGIYYQYLCDADSKFSVVTGYDDEGNEITETYTAADYLVGKTPADILQDANASQYIQTLEVYNPFIYGYVTVKAFRNALFEHVGITQEETDLINDDVQITKTLDSNEIKFSDCIKAICQINAVFGHISKDGVFRYVSLGETAEDFSGNYKATNTTFEEYSTKAINSVRLYGNSGDITTIYGAGTNYWSISNNFLLYNLSTEVLEGVAKNLYEAVKDIVYTPVSLEALLSLLPVSIGAPLTFTTHTGQSVTSYILKDRLSGAQLTNQTIEADGNEIRDSSLSTADLLGMLSSKTTAIVEKVYEKITVDSAEIKVISGDLANYKVIVAESIQAVSADIEKIRAESITTENFEAKVAELGILTAETADLKYATISQLNAEAARLTVVEGDLASYKTTISDELLVAKGWMAEGSIGDAQISSVSANKLTAGTIDTAIVTIAGTDGRLQISDNTIQISDDSTVRVQIGKDASGDYSMSVWDASGNLIWDALGATEHTIQRQIIRDSMVANDAAIQALKIDFQSFDTALTEQGVVISGTVVQVGSKTLNVILSEQEQINTDYSETLSTHSSQIAANEQEISLRVSTQVYESGMAAMESSLQTVETTVELMDGKIALKVEQKDIDQAIDNMQIGARNLIRNAKTLIFEDYYFGDTNTYLTDENGDRLLDENGDYLIA